MEEFEKYWKKLEASGDLDYFATPKEAGEVVWKAALKWVSRFTESYSIKKELKGKD